MAFGFGIDGYGEECTQEEGLGEVRRAFGYNLSKRLDHGCNDKDTADDWNAILSNISSERGLCFPR